MIRNILSTAGSRLITGFILLGVLFLHTNYLGTSILGDITLFKIALTINNLIAAICCGPAIVYVCNRYKPSEVFIPAFVWITITSIGISLTQALLGLFPTEYTGWMITCSFMFALQVFYENILLSRERILIYNTSALLHHTLLIAVTFYLIDFSPVLSAYNYIYALAIALAVNLTFLVFTTWKAMNYSMLRVKAEVFNLLFVSGFMAQLTNFIQTLNYRVSVYFLFRYWGKNAVGYFGACLQLAEAIWIIGKSLALIQYARLVSSKDKQYQVRFTLLFSKVCLLFTLLASGCILVLPEHFMVYVLGPEFAGVKYYLLLLIPGILCFSLVLVLAGFYSAQGRFYVNTIGSALSLMIIAISGYMVIPENGITGASIVYSTGLAALMVFYLFIFTIYNRVSLLQFFPNRADFKQVKSIIRDYKVKKVK
ncbi:MAG: lipopolysaccharide biosynthesis protein [Flavobacteriales bacterium]